MCLTDVDIIVFIGVWAVLHVAAPLSGKADPAGMIDAAAGGALNIIRQATSKGIKRIVLTSSIAAILNMNKLHKILYDDPSIAIKETG